MIHVNLNGPDKECDWNNNNEKKKKTEHTPIYEHFGAVLHLFQTDSAHTV